MKEELHYIETIMRSVSNMKIRNKDLRAEMVDHYCAMYEDLLAKEVQSDDALKKVEASMHKLDLSTLKKHKGMMTIKMVALFSLLFCTGYYTLFFDGNQENLEVSEEFIPANDLTSTYSAIDEIADPPYGSPLEELEISSGFGPRYHPVTKKMRFHKGIDLIAPIGTDVISVESGTVIDCGFHKKNGFYIEIQHDAVYSTRYLHLQSYDVEIGDKIIKNQVIGKVGNSGSALSPHLHYEIIKSGTWVDVAEYLKA